MATSTPPSCRTALALYRLSTDAVFTLCSQFVVSNVRVRRAAALHVVPTRVIEHGLGRSLSIMTSDMTMKKYMNDKVGCRDY